MGMPDECASPCAVRSLAGDLNVSAHAAWFIARPTTTKSRASPSVIKRGKVLVRCWANCSQEAVLAALQERGLWSTPRPKTTRRKVRTTQWRIAGYVHEKTEFSDGSKDFKWKREDGTYGLNGTSVNSLPLYGADKLDGLPPDATIVVTEGEKAADSLNSREIPAVGTVTGAHETPCPDSLAVLANYNVILWPDADQAGRDHMHRIAARLQELQA